jgi:methylenetetrahydrofolate reductase (NADPH)
MEYQSLLHKKLLDGNFVYTAETTPPDSADQEVILTKTKPLKYIADAVNLTDSPGAKVHMSALTAAIILAQNDIEPILQLTVRDRNRLALQGDLVGASALGVHNILCLSGDDPKIGDQPETIAVNDIDSLTLVATADLMRRKGKFPSGRLIESPPKLCIGGAEVTTEGKPNTEKILNKIKVGINFFQTQYVFDKKFIPTLILFKIFSVFGFPSVVTSAPPIHNFGGDSINLPEGNFPFLRIKSAVATKVKLSISFTAMVSG